MSDKSISQGPRSIAIISGKGGSGKTMVAALLAKVLDELTGEPIVLMDADTGTGGLTYYLGLKLVQNIKYGLAEVALRKDDSDVVSLIRKGVKPVRDYSKTYFFGIGDQRRLYREITEGTQISDALTSVLRALQAQGNWVVVDCRGGIDRDSIEVCSSVDDIIIITELDTTSIQATQNVVDILSRQDLAYKLRGFIINKVFDDPSTLARNGTSMFGSQYLSSIPFDLRATRAFFVGDVPDLRSLFGIHVWEGMSKAYPEEIRPPDGRVWRFSDFREVGLSNLDSLRGGVVALALLFFVASYFFSSIWALPPSYRFGLPLYAWITLISLFVVGTLGAIEATRRRLGRAIDLYTRVLGRVFFGRERKE